MSEQTLVPTSELEAVNIILAGIGEDALTSLDEDLSGDAATALMRLRTTSREVQKRGWLFNSEDAVTLKVGTDKKIMVPGNALKVDTAPDSAEFDVVHRGSYLYDRAKSTYEFDVDLVCKVVFFLAFDELPEGARWYITIRAARRFVDGAIGDGASHQFTKQDEAEARMEIIETDTELSNFNMLSDSPTAISQR